MRSISPHPLRPNAVIRARLIRRWIAAAFVVFVVIFGGLIMPTLLIGIVTVKVRRIRLPK